MGTAPAFGSAFFGVLAGAQKADGKCEVFQPLEYEKVSVFLAASIALGTCGDKGSVPYSVDYRSCKTEEGDGSGEYFHRRRGNGSSR